jgi:hypothetical protein
MAAESEDLAVKSEYAFLLDSQTRDSEIKMEVEEPLPPARPARSRFVKKVKDVAVKTEYA